MANQKNKKTNALRVLDQAGINYQEFSFPWDEEHLEAKAVADKLGISSEKIYKTLVTVGNKTGPVIAVIPGNATLDLKKLAKVSGNKHNEMLDLKKLEATTGYIRGGCSPIGMKKHFPTFIDDSAKELGNIIVSAGRRGYQIEVRTIDLLEVTNGECVNLTLEGVKE